MRVRGDSVECLLDDRVVTSAYTDNALKSGGIGFTTWDPNPLNSELAVNRVYVEKY